MSLISHLSISFHLVTSWQFSSTLDREYHSLLLSASRLSTSHRFVFFVEMYFRYKKSFVSAERENQHVWKSAVCRRDINWWKLNNTYDTLNRRIATTAYVVLRKYEAVRVCIYDRGAIVIGEKFDRLEGLEEFRPKRKYPESMWKTRWKLKFEISPRNFKLEGYERSWNISEKFDPEFRSCMKIVSSRKFVKI